ncbi:TIR domain-containing protein [Autumnicola edwardsiae]|uniref:TIR domain-containing protein n=1 Tax=Autumnicola edwardsiae TaxID=3075594 RepID=A0ABU3CYM9_9FLAO|nr:TIR domain-containing protein [Zunongwangia sp. F297]MDT0651297.1 TIR domain-containing protein [Zunongwangia sp. F297]
MNVFISYSQKDKKYADLISEKLKSNGHDVWYDDWKLRAGDNLINKLEEGLRSADAIIIIVSEHSLQSKWVMQEYTAIAFSEISKKRQRIIPVLVDQSTVPQYLSRYVYVDLTLDISLGIQRILKALAEDERDEDQEPTKIKRSYDKTYQSLAKALQAGKLTLICGAGVSIGAGIPSWNSLLLRLLESMMVKISNDHSISLKDVSVDEFQRRLGSSSLMIGKYLRSNLGKDFLLELRVSLYRSNPTSCELIDAIVELARPQRNGKPLDSIITFNFDGLIEENLATSNIKHKSVSAEGLRSNPAELPVYHVHGFLPRKGRITRETEIVFSEDSYHTQFIDPFSWSNLIQLNKLSQNNCLLIGLSLTDPNLRRLLDVSNRKDPSNNLNHYIIKKTPDFTNSTKTIDKMSMLLEEQDANELGLNVIWVDDFDDIPKAVRKIIV